MSLFEECRQIQFLFYLASFRNIEQIAVLRHQELHLFWLPMGKKVSGIHYTVAVEILSDPEGILSFLLGTETPRQSLTQ